MWSFQKWLILVDVGLKRGNEGKVSGKRGFLLPTEEASSPPNRCHEREAILLCLLYLMGKQPQMLCFWGVRPGKSSFKRTYPCSLSYSKFSLLQAMALATTLEVPSASCSRLLQHLRAGFSLPDPEQHQRARKGSHTNKEQLVFFLQNQCLPDMKVK